MGIFPSGVGLFPPFCAPFSPRTSGLRIAPVPGRIYGQSRFLAGRLLPRRGGGAGLRRKQGRSSFVFLCFASSLSRFLCCPHPWTEGHVAFAPGSASPPLQQPVSVSFSYFRQKIRCFLVFVFANPFPNPPRPNRKPPGVHGILVSGSWSPSHLGRCCWVICSHPVLESNPLSCTQMAVFWTSYLDHLSFGPFLGLGLFCFLGLSVFRPSGRPFFFGESFFLAFF